MLSSSSKLPMGNWFHGISATFFPQIQPSLLVSFLASFHVLSPHSWPLIHPASSNTPNLCVCYMVYCAAEKNISWLQCYFGDGFLLKPLLFRKKTHSSIQNVFVNEWILLPTLLILKTFSFLNLGYSPIGNFKMGSKGSRNILPNQI